MCVCTFWFGSSDELQQSRHDTIPSHGQRRKPTTQKEHLKLQEHGANHCAHLAACTPFASSQLCSMYKPRMRRVAAQAGLQVADLL